MLARVDLDHGPASCYWVGHFIAPELVVRVPFVEVAWVALLRSLPVSSEPPTCETSNLNNWVAVFADSGAARTRCPVFRC